MDKPARILDLDLDFFLDGVSSGRRGPREPDEEYEVWEDKRVVAFLEGQLGLSRDRRIPGRFVTHHYEAFLFWRELIRGGLETPFPVVHVDAHADLGMGIGGFEYLLDTFMHQRVQDRTDPKIEEQAMNVGNYLLFALANHWIADLTFVPLEKPTDLWYLFFKDYDIESGFLQLRRFEPGKLKAVHDHFIIPTPVQLKTAIKPLAEEEEVPFRIIRHEEYRNPEPFTHMLLCHSPPYTPPKADRLIPIIQEYFAPI